MKPVLSFNAPRVLFVLLLLAALTLEQTACAQAPLNADSLKSVLVSASDTTRVRVLNQLALTLRAKDRPASFSYAKEAVELSRQLSFRKGEALALHRLAIAYGFRNDFDSALIVLRASKEVAEKENLWKLVGDNALNEGGIHDTRSSNAKAFQSYQEAYQAYEKAGHRNGMASALYGIGNTYKDEKKYDQALENYDQSIRLFNEIGEPQEIPKVLVNVALLYEATGDLPQAIVKFTEAIDGFKQYKNPRGRATALMYRATARHEQHDDSGSLIDLDS